MIKEVTVTKFKRFANETFNFAGRNLIVCAGPNSSGKSTLLHALAVWAFGVSVVRQFKGERALRSGYSGQGAGISDDDFTPINIPDLKHLWNNLKYGGAAASYSMSITVKWEDPEILLGAPLTLRTLTMAFSLVQDRLYIKASQSNLEPDSKIPSIVYVPPVAGVDAREEFATVPKRRAMLGRGLAGAVLRNYLYDLALASRSEKTRLRNEKGSKRLSKKELIEFKDKDPWERLNEISRSTFGFELAVLDFNPDFHSVLRVNVQPKKREGGSWRNSGVVRDLMVEGSGAQQWLTVLTFALSPDTDVLLLDEPDAHLFTALKLDLIEILDELAKSNSGPQIFLATHATEILKRHPLDDILNFGGKKPSFLVSDSERSKLISGLGDEYSQLIDKARSSKALLFVENQSDADILKEIAKTCGILFPQNLAIQVTTDKHSERLRIYKCLLGAISGLKAVSIRDRDDAPLRTVDNATLLDKCCERKHYPDFMPVTWVRREIENYALNADALVKKVGEKQVEEWWKARGWSWPWNPDAEESLIVIDAKKMLDELLGKNQVKPFLRDLEIDDVHKDIIIALNYIAKMG